MAIADVKEYTHLSEEEVEQIGRELDAIRAEIEESRCAADAAYINRLIKIQRGLAAAGRVTLFASNKKPAWAAGAAMLALAKILENMEIGHNVMHGQWDWMNDPEIHSSNWEWDTAQPAEQWKHSHNYIHHQFTNVLGYDNDIGYGILRMAREQRWHPVNIGQPIYNAMLATLFQWGVALHDLDLERIRKGQKDPKVMKRQLRQIFRKGRNQILKDYVVYPALSGKSWKSTLTANMTANLARNLWAYVIIFCGHFPDGAVHFTEEEIEDETRAEWYLRQVLGAANFKGGPLLHILSGNLGFQIEHHLYPDLPSNRYAQISERVQALCDKYDIPYTTGPLHRQYGQALRTIIKLSVPNDWTKSNDPAPPERADTADAPPRDHKRRSDDERPSRRVELGAWQRSRAERRHRDDRQEDRRMDPAPRAFAELPLDPELGTPVPFACGTDDPYGAARDGSPLSARHLDGRRVTQCALSRICGACGSGLGRPLAFLGSPDEAGRNAFHLPPMHVECARALREAYDGVTASVLGQATPVPSWELVTSSSFEFVRPGRDQVDRRPTFQPGVLLSQ